MKIIIKYKKFETSEDFEKWQLDNDITICSIVPCTVGLNHKFSHALITESIPSESYGYYDTGIIVLYHEGEVDEIPS